MAKIFEFLKDDRVSSGIINMAKIYERVLSLITAKRKDDTRLVALLGIRIYLGVLRPSRSSLTLQCLLRG